MKKDINIDVHHLTRVEGHGNIHISIKNGELKEAKWEVVETPRFFEAMLRGMSHELAPILTSRICGICSIGHTLAGLRAAERALGVEIPETAKTLRLLAKHGETLQSHVLHVMFLAAPDFFNVPSVLPIVQLNPQLATIAVKLKGLGNKMCDIIAGRTTHPVNLVVGGVNMAPDKADLKWLKDELQASLNDVITTVTFFKTLQMPDFVRETEFVSLKGVKEYPWIGGDLVSTDGVVKKEDEYLAMTNEYKVDFSTSKFTRLSRGSMAVGALARLNNNFKFLHPKAREASEMLGLKPVNHNPFMNNVAQLVETYHVMLESIDILAKLLDSDMSEVKTAYKAKKGRGVGAVEVPRGILYHDYELDNDGKIVKANCIIPTTQNNANIHYDLPELVKKMYKQGKDDKELTKLSEMLVRAYDPCISCSVH